MPAAYLSMFSLFRAYDDEGYFLFALKGYLSGRSLFTEALPIYGPFYYEVIGGIYKVLGLEPSHDSGRFLTLGVWLLASLVSGLAVYRLTRNRWLGLGAQLVTFIALAALIDEPMHPSGIVSLLLVSLVAAAAFRSSRPRSTAVLIGVIVGGLCMVKINVGVFAATAVVFAWGGSMSYRWNRLFFPLVAVLIAALPWMLMASQLNLHWVLAFAILVSLSASAVGLAAVAGTPRPLPDPSASWVASGGAFIVIASLGVAMAGGTRLVDLWNGSVVLAGRLPQLFIYPPAISAVVDLWAAISLGAAIAIFTVLRGRMPDPIAGLVRIGVGLFIWLSLLQLPSSLFLLVLPLAWVAIRKPGDEVGDPVNNYCRLLLPALAVVECLQAYPIAGTQLSLAALTLVPIGAICLSDGQRQLSHIVQARRWPIRLVAPAAAVMTGTAFLGFGLMALSAYRSDSQLDLPGAAFVRLPAPQVNQLRSTVAAIKRDCSSFITYPGMNSFYFWTAQQPPTQGTSEVWMFVLDDEQQKSIVGQLQGRERLCVVKNQRVIDFWKQGRQVPSRPLVEFIDANFVDDGSYGDYQLLIRR